MVAASPAKIELGLTEKVGVTGAAASGCEKPIAPMMAAAKSVEKIDLIIAPRRGGIWLQLNRVGRNRPII